MASPARYETSKRLIPGGMAEPAWPFDARYLREPDRAEIRRTSEVWAREMYRLRLDTLSGCSQPNLFRANGGLL